MPDATKSNCDTYTITIKVKEFSKSLSSDETARGGAKFYLLGQQSRMRDEAEGPSAVKNGSGKDGGQRPISDIGI